ncbi:MAG: DUF1592 domain-containing protein [Polyangiales bacterium]
MVVTRRSLALGSAMLALGCVGQVSPPEGASAVDARVFEAAVVDARADSPAADARPLEDAAIPDVPVTPPGPPDPGRVTLHRLNRVEYNNTVRDLFGTTRTPADDFPADDRGYGFDNIADVLTMSPVQLELYQSAAETLVNEALRNPVVPSVRRQFEGESLTGSVGAATSTAWNLWSNGELPARLTPTAPGRFHITVRAWQSRGGPDDAHMNILVDGRAIMGFAVPNLSSSPGEFSADVTLTSTTSVTVAAEFTNDFYDPTAMQDRNLYVDWIRVDGPIDASGPPNPVRARILSCDPTAAAGEAACARQVIAAFARKAWRRPVTDAEVTRLAALLDVAHAQGEGFEAGIRLALQAVILSPHFVFRVELDADPTSTVAHPLNDHELASRLSYFLWSSMPDDALFALADAGRLRDPATLRAQVTRMLADPKARALTDNFAGQWLYTRSLADHDADPARFPAYTPTLRAAFKAETEAYFEAFLREDIGMDQFLTAPFTFVDDGLARFYGITAPTGTGLRRVALTGDRRGGLLTQASLLTVNSHADRTSPVRRGQWVLNQLMCEPPPPPPGDVMGLPPETIPTGSLRQRFEAHRAEPRCATCHALMDPIGFAFEHFDAVGAWRDRDEGFAIDTTGTLPGTGAMFDGATALATLLARDPRYPRCVTRQWFTYALGRGPEPYDDDDLDTISHDWSAAGMRLRDLVVRIVTSEAFTQRRGEPVGGMR